MAIEYEIESKNEDLDHKEREKSDWYVKREKAWLALKSEACGFTAERILCVD